ncbi:MAG: metalloregulator ArsR/SmtB family transcription factor [Paracoccus sp. (in: a-proteobacteria)]|uniref:ArsR/SmtB family transcription factor n=1 Tax=Paracoccus sp. TaxID=267 RepID=UPI0026DFC69F|nr:metalloregulator ArsR/SmtB family transcription factor [Paracoccus sp. (in: a-proteobacteria)]MDO5620467.1 metalloregulator ArsR/SmtB family transcription factor [Paracoccus sp. (in: a-proteobacteria)]
MTETITDPAEMAARAAEAATFLKALAHEGRLMILCHLSGGERSVSELEQLLGQRQAAVSQQLARLRDEGLVTCRAEGKARLYSIADPNAARIVGLLAEMFCTP